MAAPLLDHDPKKTSNPPPKKSITSSKFKPSKLGSRTLLYYTVSLQARLKSPGL